MASEPPRPSVVTSLLSADTLEAGDQDDQAGVEGVPQPARRDVDDLGVAVGAGGDHPGLRPGERAGLRAQRLDGHRDQRVGDPLAGGQQHVHLARRRRRGHLAGQIQQVVGGVAHRRNDDDHLVTGFLGLDDALGDTADALGVRHRGSAVLLYDECHRQTFQPLCKIPPRIRVWRISFTPPEFRRDCGQIVEAHNRDLAAVSTRWRRLHVGNTRILST